jgi:hypothetical protein
MELAEKKYVTAACIMAAIATAGTLFGITGIRVILGMLVIFAVPSYLILRNFVKDEMERAFFAFFLGFGFLPILAFYANKMIPSLKMSVLASFLILLAAGLALKYHGQKPKTS